MSCLATLAPLFSEITDDLDQLLRDEQVECLTGSIEPKLSSAFCLGLCKLVLSAYNDPHRIEDLRQTQTTRHDDLFQKSIDEISPANNPDDRDEQEQPWQDPNESLKSILSTLMEDMDEKHVVQLLFLLASIAASGSRLELSQEQIQKLISALVSKTDDLVNHQDKIFKSTNEEGNRLEFDATFAIQASLLFACLAMTFRLSRPGKTSKDTNAPTRSSKQVFKSEHIRISDWFDSLFRASINRYSTLPFTTLLWLMFEYQNFRWLHLHLYLLIVFSPQRSSKWNSAWFIFINASEMIANRIQLPPHFVYIDMSKVLQRVTLKFDSDSFLASYILRTINSIYKISSIDDRLELLSSSTDFLLNSLKAIDFYAPLVTGNQETSLKDSTPHCICFWAFSLVETIISIPPAPFPSRINRQYLDIIIDCATPISFQKPHCLLNCSAISLLATVKNRSHNIKFQKEVSDEQRIRLARIWCSLRYMSLFIPSFFMIQSTNDVIKNVIDTYNVEDLQSVASSTADDFKHILSLLLPSPLDKLYPKAKNIIIDEIKVIASNAIAQIKTDISLTEFWDHCESLQTRTLPRNTSLLIFQLARIGLKSNESMNEALYYWNNPPIESPIDIVRPILNQILDDSDSTIPIHDRLASTFRSGFLKRNMWQLNVNDKEEISDFKEHWNLVAHKLIYYCPLEPKDGYVKLEWHRKDCRVVNGWPESTNQDSMKEDPNDSQTLSIQAAKLLDRLKTPDIQHVLLFYACDSKELGPRGLVLEPRDTQDFGTDSRKYFYRKLYPAIQWALRRKNNVRVIPDPVVLCFDVNLSPDPMPNCLIEQKAVALNVPTNQYEHSDWAAVIFCSRSKRCDIGIIFWAS